MPGAKWYMAATYVGAVVGAGFASGREALVFFVAYGGKGAWGLVLAAAGFMAVGGLSFGLAQECGLPSYQQILAVICGKRWAKAYDILVTWFLLAGIGVMLAGAGSLVRQQWGVHSLWGVLLTGAVAGLACVKGMRGVLMVNALLVPGMVLSGAALGIYGLVQVLPLLCERGAGALWTVAGTGLIPNWWVAGSLYLAYNSLLGSVACMPVAASQPSKGSAVFSGIMGGVILGMLLMANCLAVWAAGPGAAQQSVPLLWIATAINPVLGSCYGLIIWSAMLTTAAINLFAVVHRFGRPSSEPGAIMALVAAFLLSTAGFDYLVGLLYPVFGYLGMVYIVKLLSYFGSRRWMGHSGKGGPPSG